MSGTYTQYEEVLGLARQMVESNEKCRRFILEKQKKFGNEYILQLDTILLRPGGREAVLRALFYGQNEGCEFVLDVDREVVRSLKNYLGSTIMGRK